MRRYRLALSALLVTTGCSGGGSDGGDSTSGSGGGVSQAGSSMGGASGSTSAGSSTGGSSAGAGGTSGGTTSGGTTGKAGDGGTGGGFATYGVCSQRGQSKVSTKAFEGYEEYVLIGEKGFGSDICVVRFDVARSGDPPPGCVDLDGKACAWSHRVRYSNPQTMVDVDGVCANSERGMDMAAIDAIDGSEVSYGFVTEYAGHNSVLLKEMGGSWQPYGNATWEEAEGVLGFDNRDGKCGY